MASAGGAAAGPSLSARAAVVGAAEQRVAARFGCVLKLSPRLNGVHFRYAEAALPNNSGRPAGAGSGGLGGPLVLFLHGWPESWYSWRHQLQAMAKAGFHAVAPDMRGYGGSFAPAGPKEEYSIHRLAGDALALVHFLGYSQCVLVGHDWGAWLTWQLAVLHPEVFTCICAMSVPYSGHGREGLLTSLRRMYGDERRERQAAHAGRQKFNYMLHHNLDEAAGMYDADIREALYCIYTSAMGIPSDPPPVKTSAMYVRNDKLTSAEAGNNGKADELVAEGLWRRIPRAKEFPDWLSSDDLDYYVRQFATTGMSGPLNWYRTMDMNWALTPQLAGAKVSQPSLFIAGDEDLVVMAMGGVDNVKEMMTKNCSVTPEIVFFEDVGHWVQQERHESVSKALLDFVQRSTAGDRGYSPTHVYSRL